MKPISAIAAGSMLLNYRYGCNWNKDEKNKWDVKLCRDSWQGVNLSWAIASSCNLFFECVPELFHNQWMLNMHNLGFRIKGYALDSSASQWNLKEGYKIQYYKYGDRAFGRKFNPSMIFNAKEPYHRSKTSELLRIGVGEGNTQLSLPHMAALYSLITRRDGKVCKPTFIRAHYDTTCADVEMKYDIDPLLNDKLVLGMEGVFGMIANTPNNEGISVDYKSTGKTGTAWCYRTALHYETGKVNPFCTDSYRVVQDPWGCDVAEVCSDTSKDGSKSKEHFIRLAGKTGSAERGTGIKGADGKELVDTDSFCVLVSDNPENSMSIDTKDKSRPIFRPLFVVVVRLKNQGKGAPSACSVGVKIMGDTLNTWHFSKYISTPKE